MPEDTKTITEYEFGYRDFMRAVRKAVGKGSTYAQMEEVTGIPANAFERLDLGVSLDIFVFVEMCNRLSICASCYLTRKTYMIQDDGSLKDMLDFS
jgi:hypothetical protein